MTVGNCMGSKYVTDIRPDVEEWEKRLGNLGFVIDEWLTFYKSWMYLENIFNAEDMQKALPKETK
jgi:dynein heavy chain